MISLSLRPLADRLMIDAAVILLVALLGIDGCTFMQNVGHKIGGPVEGFMNGMGEVHDARQLGDAEGVVVLPFKLADEIAHAALEVEEREAFALERVKAGESFRGLYPLSEERRPEYENWKATRSEDPSP